MVRLFPVNCNGIGPQSSDKLETNNKESKKIKVEGMIIRMLDVRWNARNKMIMINKLKIINSNVIVSASDSIKEVDTGSCFLKGGVFAALWVMVINYIDRENMTEQEHG